MLFTSQASAGDKLETEFHTFHYWKGCWDSKGKGRLNVYGMYNIFFPLEYAGYKLQRSKNPWNGQQQTCDDYFTKQIVNTNYSPDANFKIISQETNWSGGVNRVRIASTSTDRDGDIKKHTWWVNGIKQFETGPVLSTGTLDGGNYIIKLRVEDDGILKIDTEHKVYLNDKEKYFHQDDTIEKSVYFFPWECGRTCHID